MTYNNKIDWKIVDEDLNQFIEDNQQPLEFLNWLQELLTSKTTKKDIITEYVEALLNWYCLLITALQDEQYEICGKLVTIINIEKNNVKVLLNQLFPKSDNDSMIERITTKAKQLFTECY